MVTRGAGSSPCQSCRDHAVLPSSLEIMLPGTPKNGSFPATPARPGAGAGMLVVLGQHSFCAGRMPPSSGFCGMTSHGTRPGLVPRFVFEAPEPRCGLVGEAEDLATGGSRPFPWLLQPGLCPVEGGWPPDYLNTSGGAPPFLKTIFLDPSCTLPGTTWRPTLTHGSGCPGWPWPLSQVDRAASDHLSTQVSSLQCFYFTFS